MDRQDIKWLTWLPSGRRRLVFFLFRRRSWGGAPPSIVLFSWPPSALGRPPGGDNRLLFDCDIDEVGATAEVGRGSLRVVVDEPAEGVLWVGRGGLKVDGWGREVGVLQIATLAIGRFTGVRRPD